MFKHDCVMCLRIHNLRCLWHISFFNRFFGTDKVKYCPEYAVIMRKKYNEC
jgi:hypothetical protein